MYVLSLCDGMSCGQLALERASIKCHRYYAAEVDKYAIAVTQANYPDTIQLGDMTQWRDWRINWGDIDLVIGGTPCTGFSAGGLKKNFEDEGSKLFFTYADILEHIQARNPSVKFLLENVKMKEAWANVITQRLEVEPVRINSAELSAQLRTRDYWTNWGIVKPLDAGIFLKDIRQHNVDKKYYISEKALAGFARKTERRKDNPSSFSTMNVRRDDQKSTCISARYHKSGIGDAMINDTDGVRRLTPTEVERLQTVPDGYTDHVSNTQRYKMLGNGWTVDVIAHILSQGDF